MIETQQENQLARPARTNDFDESLHRELTEAGAFRCSVAVERSGQPTSRTRHATEADFVVFYRLLRAQIDARLGEAIRPQPGLPERLLSAMRYSLLAPGKRLRPLLVLLSAEACAPQAGVDPWPAACAIEMMHVSSLIHDDLPAMDDDDLRRGLPTCHRQFDEATAILAGDGLLIMSFEVLAQGYPRATAAACCLDLAMAAGAASMVGGQCDDLTMERGGPARRTVAELEHLHVRKTGALIRAACRMGVRAAFAETGVEPPAAVMRGLDSYGRCLGLLFQITDDLLDVEGDAARTGKRVGKDAARHKLTYPGLLGVKESRTRAQALARQATEALLPLGAAAGRLADLAAFVLARDH